jgi:hypothetical protein
LKTVLSTNFYGGKKGMKNRITSIMDTSKRRKGAIIVVLILAATLCTGFVFAANETTIDLPLPDATVEVNVAHQSSMPPPVTSSFYFNNEFGLTYNQTTGDLYFNNELVRYFEDMIPLVMPDGQSASFGTALFNESGTVDVRAIRDFSQEIINSDGSTDPSGRLLRLERLSQAEFDARNIEDLKKQLEGNNAAYANPSSNDEQQSNQANNNNNIAVANNQGGTGTIFATLYSDIENFGVTFSGNLFNGGTGNIYYNGQLVRTLMDGNGTTLSSSDRSGNINIRIIRDDNGSITDIEILDV